MVLPKPIPGGIQPFGPGTEVFHINPLMLGSSPDIELSTITDFNGMMGAAEIVGKGTATTSGIKSTLFFDADMRFMSGVYIGVDGKPHNGAFALI